MIAPGTEDDRGMFGFKRKRSEPGSTPSGDANGDEDEEALRECGARFSTNQHLKRHMESHLKTFPHIVSFLQSTLIGGFTHDLLFPPSVRNIHRAQLDSENVVHCAVTSVQLIWVLCRGHVNFRI